MGRLSKQLELLTAEVRALRVTQTPADVPRLTVGQLYMRFRAMHPRGRAWQMLRSLLRPFVRRHWRVLVAAVTAETWWTHRRERLKEPTRTGSPPKDSTLNLELSRTKGMFLFGVDAGLIPSNPIAKARPKRTRAGRETFLTPEQLDRLIDHAHVLGHRRAVLFRALAAAMGDTGLRIGEARVIRLDRISLDGTLALRSSETPKTGEAHVVGFTDRALRLFADVPRHPSSPFLLASDRNQGRPYDASTLRIWFMEVAAAAGLNAAVADGDVRLHPHDLRHTFATNADAAGAPARLIQQALGHRSMKTTERYLHGNKEQGAIRMARIVETAARIGPRRAAGPNAVDTKKEIASATVTRVESFS